MLAVGEVSLASIGSLLSPCRGCDCSLVFSFKLNLKALFFTSGEEKIGGLLAEDGPGGGAGLRTLPGDSG